jgi:hypothetical protein
MESERTTGLKERTYDDIYPRKTQKLAAYYVMYFMEVFVSILGQEAIRVI